MEPIAQIHNELDVFPAVLLAQLPLACELLTSHSRLEGEIRLRLGESAATDRRQSTAATQVQFSGLELRWLIVGVQMERFDTQDFVACCQRKLAEPGYRLGATDALAGLDGALQQLEDLEAQLFTGASLSTLELLDVLGLSITGVEELGCHERADLATAA